MSGPETVVSATRMMPALDQASASLLEMPPSRGPERPSPVGVSTEDRVEAPTGRTPRPCSEQRAISVVSEALAEGGPNLLRDVLFARPDVLARLGCMPRESIEGQVDAQLERLGRGGHASDALVVGREVIDARARDLVYREAVDRVGQRQTALTELRRELPALLPRLAHAAPNTPEASLARMLQVRGDAGDRARAESVIADGLEGIDRFSRAMAGTSWDAAQFPDARDRAFARLGMRTTQPWDLARDATSHSRPVETAAHYGLLAVDAAHVGGEIGGVFDLAGRGACGVALAADAVPLAIAAAGLGASLLMHWGAERSSERLAALGRSMGM